MTNGEACHVINEVLRFSRKYIYVFQQLRRNVLSWTNLVKQQAAFIQSTLMASVPLSLLWPNDRRWGGWTVFQRRLDGSVDFYRGLTDYKNSFGNLYGEFWLGLDKIHRLTTTVKNKLRVDLMDTKGKLLTPNTICLLLPVRRINKSWALELTQVTSVIIKNSVAVRTCSIHWLNLKQHYQLCLNKANWNPLSIR